MHHEQSTAKELGNHTKPMHLAVFRFVEDRGEERKMKAVVTLQEKFEKTKLIVVVTINYSVLGLLCSSPEGGVLLKGAKKLEDISVCPRCSSPVMNLKLLNRKYCFRCKIYVS